MKLDANVIQILKNFATIYSSLVVKQGNIISTINHSKTVFALTKLNVEFPQDFAIYDLGKFLNVISMFGDHDIQFQEKYAIIRGDDRSTLKYNFSDPSMLITAPIKEITLPSSDVEINISNKDLSDVRKALDVLQLPEISIYGENGKIYIAAVDAESIGKENKSSDSYKIELGETDKEFKAVYKSENIKVIPNDYKVTISNKLISRFEPINTNNDIPAVSYWLALDKNKSQF